jgi:two-component system, cell cycle sensor histidine kinase and response regulator CckA
MDAGKSTMQGVKTAKQTRSQILVVGEVFSFVDGLQKKLFAEGFRAVGVTSFEEAILSAQQATPELIMLDLLLAKKPLGRAILEYFQDFRQIPFVFFDSRNILSGLVNSAEDQSSSKIIRNFDSSYLNAQISSAITPSKHNVSRLPLPPRFFEPLVESIESAVVITDAEGRVVFINSLGARLTGWDADVVPGHQLGEVVLLVDQNNGCVLDILLQRQLSEEGIFGRTSRVLLKSRQGQDCCVRGTFKPVFDESGQWIGTLWAFQDITAELERESWQLQKNFELQVLCGAFPDFYLRLSTDGEILDCIGGRIWDIRGQSQVVLGKKIQDVFPFPVRDQFQEALIRVRKTRGPVNLTFTLILEEGERNYDARLIPSPENHLLFIVRDITENRHAQEALRQIEAQLRQAHKMEAIGKLAGGVAHDFNNLLTAITGYSDILLKRLPADSQLRHEVLEIKHASDRATQLTRQLLAFSRKQVVTPQFLDLKVVVSNMNKMLRRLIGEDVELVTRGNQHPAWIKADPSQIEQVILNLVVNARDALPRGGKIVIETSQMDLPEGFSGNQLKTPPGQYVLLAVSDTGCGMDEQTLSHLFELYFTTKEKGKGTGLGLSTVYGIVKQSGGSIVVQSQPGQGSRFEIYLPLADHQVELYEPKRDPLVIPRGHETVLLVEDEEVIRRMVNAILLSSGYQVLQASHGAEAVRVAREYQGDIHLMLTDVVMPEMSGYLLAEKLRVLRPDMQVIFMSGYSDETIRLHGEWNPDAPFIHKPFTPEGLNHKIRQVLDAQTLSKD